MAMTVRMLISKLKKMPATAYVGWQNHDQNEDELDGFVGSVSEAAESLYARYGDHLDGKRKRKVVVLGS